MIAEIKVRGLTWRVTEDGRILGGPASCPITITRENDAEWSFECGRLWAVGKVGADTPELAAALVFDACHSRASEVAAIFDKLKYAELEAAVFAKAMQDTPGDLVVHDGKIYRVGFWSDGKTPCFIEKKYAPHQFRAHLRRKFWHDLGESRDDVLAIMDATEKDDTASEILIAYDPYDMSLDEAVELYNQKQRPKT